MPEEILLSVTTSVGPDIFRLRAIRGEETIGRPFQYTLDLVSTDHNLKAMDFLGNTMVAKLAATESASRYFHGLITSFEFVASTTTHAAYRATLRPWFWLLSQRADCRIYQNLTVPAIIADVFSRAGFSADVRTSLSGSYSAREYCVQYRESDMAFVTRLMEQEGIYFYFEHTDAKHTLVMTDMVDANATALDLLYRPEGTGSYDESITEWGHAQHLQTTTYRLQDYNFETPASNLETSSQLVREHRHANLQVYDYPGEYGVASLGTTYAKVRIERLQAGFDLSHGTGKLTMLTCGGAFNLIDHPREDQNIKYVTLSTVFDIVGPQTEYSGTTEGSCHCHFTAFPASATYRLPGLTPEPKIPGPQTAVVVGPSGKEIWTDQYGRVKLKFHWDLIGASDENASCWVRVSQTWAGNNWGAIHIPRITQEVVVEFLEGDPDRPLVTGRVYNAAVMPPYALPDNQTQSGIKSRSTTEGDPETFNELRFEDKKGEEQIYFHAEKDFARVVENNDSLKVGFEKKDKGDQTIDIFNNQTVNIGTDQCEAGNQTLVVYKDRTATVKTGNEALTVEKGNRTITVSEGNDSHVVTKGNRDVKVDTGNDTHAIAKGNRTVTVDTGNDALTVAKGDHSITITAGSSVLEAGTAIELKVGANSIKIDTSGITIKAAKITIEADANVGVKAGAQLALEGLTASLSGSATAEVKGGIVKLN